LIGRVRVHGLIRVACYLAIAALALMVWSVLRPAALPVVIGMSVGQVLGVLAFLCYILAVLTDVRRAPPASIAPSSSFGPPSSEAPPSSIGPPSSGVGLERE
jgi:hypothetical protein